MLGFMKNLVVVPSKCGAQALKSEAKTFRSAPGGWTQYRS